MKFVLTAAVAVSFVAGAVGGPAAPVWKAPAPDARSLVVTLADGDAIRVDTLAENLFRVRRGKGPDWTESGLNRYGILKADWPEVAFERTDGGVRTKAAELSVDPRTGALRFVSRVSAADVAVDPKRAGKGFAVRFSLAKDERIYGLGDCSRDEIMRRGKRYDIWIRNNLCNIPVPVAYGRSGWGVLLNSTWRHAWDVGAKDPDAMTAEAAEGEIDFYLFAGRDYRELLDTYTRLSGRPALLPVWGYGLTFVGNQNIDQFNVVNECMQFRDRDLPCDVYGLEPGWMEKFYDNSIYKEWNSQRFYFPYWHPKGGLTWIAAMKRIGFKLSLWLCCDYDLFRYEEQCAAGLAKNAGRPVELPDDVSDTWEDDRINPKAGGKGAEPVKSRHRQRMYRLLNCPEDTVPDGMLPWFEHLKKFVDQGVQCFKLDGCNQFGEHPNRKWANGRSDEEMHNLYSDVYDKQMARGYEAHTGRRAMVYSAGGYAGLQQFVATWAGDTGGGEKPLASFLNLGISGHSNQSCDMSIFDMSSLHFGFLQTWSQLSNWDYWYQPWLQEPERVAAYRGYVHLRYRLLPYLYTAAAEASRTGWPVMRALSFVYPDEPAYDEVKTTYFLGPDLLVSAFAKETVLPPGLWHEWRTDAATKGPATVPVARDDTWGGGLYVRAGAVIPTWPVRQHVDAGFGKEVIFEAWPTADGSAELYEDDGVSLGYRTGAFARTPLTLTAKDGSIVFTVGPRRGSFGGMPSARRCTVRFHALDRAPKSALLDGKPVAGAYDAAAQVYAVELGDVGAAGVRLALTCAGQAAQGVHAGKKAVLGDTSANYVEVTDPVVKANIERFRDMKLGLMMHFGPYSQVGITESWPLLDPARGWERRRALHMDVGDAFRSNYWNLAKTFNPIRFDADAWAEAAAENGFKYLCFTTKHHDGFAMYDTKHSDYKITSKDCPYSTRPNADMVRDIWDAFRRRGLAISCYFSKADWHHEDYWENRGVGRTVGTLPTYDTAKQPEKWARFEQFMRNQMVELCRDYGRIEVMWLDCAFVGDRPQTQVDLSGILAECRKHQPWLIAANRGIPGVNEQIVTPEQAVPPEPLSCPWESCITMGTGWSYRFDDTYKSARELIQMFVGIVAKGGCLALNVGPRPDGVIPDPALRRMRAMGAWLRANGKAIYASRPFAPYAVRNWRFTRRDGHYYAIRLADEGEHDVREALLSDEKSKDWQLARIVHVATGREIPFARTAGGWLLRLPQGFETDAAADAFELFFK